MEIVFEMIDVLYQGIVEAFKMNGDQILDSFLFFVIVCLLSKFFAIPSVRGKFGEFKVHSILSSIVKKNPGKYILLDDLMVRLSNGKTTQIDHVLLSCYGIFVIENKHYSGRIYGKVRSGYWTQYAGNKKSNMYNPIRQNWGHIKALEEILHISESSFQSLVCFSGSAYVKLDDCTNVVLSKDLKKEILSYQKPIFQGGQIREYAIMLKGRDIVDKKERRQHVKDIKVNQEQRTFKIDQGICPQCGGKLVLRNGRYGEFYGCSNYPKCKFTEKLNDWE